MTSIALGALGDKYPEGVLEDYACAFVIFFELCHSIAWVVHGLYVRAVDVGILFTSEDLFLLYTIKRLDNFLYFSKRKPKLKVIDILPNKDSDWRHHYFFLKISPRTNGDSFMGIF